MEYLKDIIEDSEFHLLVLNGYNGPYSMGISVDQKVTVSICGQSDLILSGVVTFKGRKIEIEVEKDWQCIERL